MALIYLIVHREDKAPALTATSMEKAKNLLDCLIDKYDLSARAIQRVRRVARTIADLDARPTIEAEHFAEAFQYRFKSL